MIKSLKIQNYALIENLEIQIDGGLTIITGETGSGKSIILGALGLIMGQRADLTVIQNPEKKCVVEAIFDVSKYNLKAFFDKADIDYFDTAIIRREISAEGRSRAFVNDTPVNLSTLKEITTALIDIHSQHDTLELNNYIFQTETLDLFAKNQQILEKYQTIFSQYKKTVAELETLEQSAQQQKNDYDYFQFQFNQLDEVNLQPDEQEELENEQMQLSHTEEIKQNLSKINFLLDNDDVSIISMLKEALKSAENITEFLPQATEIAKRLESDLIDLQDLSTETQVIEADIDVNPERLEYVNTRLDTIYKLQHKFNVQTIDELLKIKDEFQQKLLEIDSFDEQIEQEKQQISKLKQQLTELAEQLHSRRTAVKEKFERQIVKLVTGLGMPEAKFMVDIATIADFTNFGTDKVAFLFSANKNTVPQLIGKIASGGELSRLMLAIKYIISRSKTLPTIIFDEIDTGISGEIADKTGLLLKAMAENMQIINITHLPQIAAKADSHFLVYKDSSGDKTISHIKKLSDNERIMEIAKMLSGANISENAILNAKELLDL